jgi:hypothetical protein
MLKHQQSAVVIFTHYFSHDTLSLVAYPELPVAGEVMWLRRPGLTGSSVTPI